MTVRDEQEKHASHLLGKFTLCTHAFVACALCVSQMFALARQFSQLIGADSDLEIPGDCEYSTNRKGDYNGYDGGFVVNVRVFVHDIFDVCGIGCHNPDVSSFCGLKMP